MVSGRTLGRSPLKVTRPATTFLVGVAAAASAVSIFFASCIATAMPATSTALTPMPRGFKMFMAGV